MFSYTMIQWLFIFYFYCFIGWCIESCFVSFNKKKWVNRGFIKGPFLPLYGSGAVMMLVISKPFLEHWWAVFIAGCIGATILELITGIVMEALFKVRYWDYSNQRFHFKGYICLSSSIAWGGLTMLMNYVVHEPVEAIVFAIPSKVLMVITITLTIYIAGDFTLSFKAALDLRDLLVLIENAKQDLMRLQKRLDDMIAMAGDEWNIKKESLSGSVEQRKDTIMDAIHLDEIKSGIEKSLNTLKEMITKKPVKYWQDFREEILDLYTEYKMHDKNHEKLGRLKALGRRIRNNPTMSSGKYKEALEDLKQKLDKWKKK